MSMPKSENVAVFWDYENCPAPASTSGYAIANSISALARSFGTVKVFKAYLEISDQSRSSLRSELQSSGVSLVDCPHNGRKDVADKMILVDMLSYVIDNPAPSTIFLITGDRDFAYALSTLKNRHYKVILVKRPDTHVSLTFQACICFDWFDNVVHQAENPSSQAEQSPQQLPYHRRQHSNSHCNMYASASGLSPHSTTEDPFGSGTDAEETADIVHLFRDRIPDRVPPAFQELPQISTATDEAPRQDREVYSSPRQGRDPSLSTRQGSISALVQEEVQEVPLSAAKPRARSESHYTTLREKTLPKHKLPVRSRSADMDDAKARTRSFLEPTKADVTSSTPPLSSPIIWPSPAPPMTPKSTEVRRIVHKWTGSSVKAMRSMGDPPMSVEELAGKFLKKELPTSPSSATLATSSPSSKSSTSGTRAVDSLKPARTIKPRNANAVNPPTRSSGRSVPPNFVILVEALQWQRSQGIFQPFRNVIAERIRKGGTTYQKAGVSSFREYSLLAERAGIVDMGGEGGRDWICLKPKWHTVHVSAPTTIVC